MNKQSQNIYAYIVNLYEGVCVHMYMSVDICTTTPFVHPMVVHTYVYMMSVDNLYDHTIRSCIIRWTG
jgi:hypothetical protein